MNRLAVPLLKLLVGVLLFAGLPLVSWGVGDLVGYLAHPARQAYLVVIVLLQLIVVARFPAIGGQQGAGVQLVRRQQIAIVLLQVLSLAIVIAAPYADRRAILALPEAPLVRGAGLLMVALGFLVMSAAEATLGRQFSTQVTLQEQHQLITAGLYRVLRHPRYAGIIGLNLGIALTFSSGLALILVVALSAVLLWRIHDEEALLAAAFGPAWEDYARRSWRLIPRVY